MEYFIELNEQPYIKPIPGLKAKVVHSESQSVAFWKIEAGAVLPEHHHPQEQLSIVTLGQLELTVNGNTQLVGPGKVVVIPSNAPHSARALSYVEVTDVFHPLRNDLKPPME